MNGIAGVGRCRSRGRERLDAMTATDKPRRELRRMRGGATDVRGPNARDDQHVHAGSSFAVPRSRPSCTVQNAAKTADEPINAAAAPTAPYNDANTITSGTSATISISCAAVRSPGRPIETGNDFVQPKTSWIAAATSISLTASVAPA